MADEKTYTEPEHIAILADRVATETASLTAANGELKTSVDDLSSKLDVAEAARVAAEAKAETAAKEFEDFKAELETLREAAERKDERVDAVKEVAAHLGEDFFKDEARIERIVAMSDEAFTGYVEDLKATAPAGEQPTTVVPRETAMNGTPAANKGADSAAKSVLLGRYPGGN